VLTQLKQRSIKPAGAHAGEARVDMSLDKVFVAGFGGAFIPWWL
jgi:hypothetical protein